MSWFVCRGMPLVLWMAGVVGGGEPAQNAAPLPTPPADHSSAGWLNVRDYGASGSIFETTAAATAGSQQITVANVGDFQVGQGVMVSKCHPHFERCILKPPENPYGTNPLGDAAELRGYDGSGGSWLVFLVEVNGADPLTFRWSDDMAQTWKGTQGSRHVRLAAAQQRRGNQVQETGVAAGPHDHLPAHATSW